MDITNRKNAEESLRLHKEKLSRIISISSELICEVDEHRRYSFTSDNYQKVIGYTSEELIGKNVFDFMHPDDIKKALEKYGDGRQDMSNTIDIWRFRHSNGEYKKFECRGSAYRAESGALMTVVVSHELPA